MKILIVDDNKNMRDFIKGRITFLGYDTFEAHNGLAAVAAYKVYQPEIILMDIEMEIMDGIEAVIELRKISPSVKIIMLTNYSEKALKEKAFAAGADDYVQKENLMELEKRINQLKKSIN